jgi:glycosyltransferase involved in cell wall biosynthesis
MNTGSGPRILAVTTNFPPDAAVGTMRTLRLVRHLDHEGWAVDVLTLSPDGFRPGTVSDPALLSKVPPAVTVLRAMPWRPFERLTAMLKGGRRTSKSAPAAGPAAPPAPGREGGGAQAPRGVSRLRRAVTAALTLPDREVSWLLPAAWAAWRRMRHARPDVVYSSGPPFTAHFVAYIAARLSGAPWVADFRDPWARAPWREDRFEFERRAWAVLERFVATRATTVVFVTTTNRDDFARTYGPEVAARFVVVPNGCDVRDFDSLAPAAQPGLFVLLHAGSLYGARNPEGLFRAVAAAIRNGTVDKSSFRLRFLGRVGIHTVDLPALARELGLEDVVEFVSHVPRRASLQQMVDASALLIVQPVTTVSIPAKMYEYLAAGRPILALAEPGGETATLVERTKAGVVVPADDEGAIAAGLASVVQLARTGFTPVDSRAYDGDIRASEQRDVLARAIGAGR